MKFDRTKHVELLMVSGEALVMPSLFAAAAELTRVLGDRGVHVEHDDQGLRYFRDMEAEELAAAEAIAAAGTKQRAEYAQRREQEDRARAAEWGWTYEEYVERQRKIRGY